MKIRSLFNTRLDSKDFLLLVALHENARQSYRSLGKRASLSAPATRDRLEHLKTRGIIQGFWLSMDPRIFGLYDTLIFFRSEITRKQAERAAEVTGTAWVALKLDGGMTVQLWSKEAKPLVLIGELEKAVGKTSDGAAFSESLNYQRQNFKLSPLDWNLLDCLVEDPLMNFGRLVSITGLSPKTVRNHLEALIRDEVIYILPILGSLADSGELLFQIAINGKITLPVIREIMGDVFLINETNDPPIKYLLCKGTNLPDVTTKTAKLNRLSDVESATLALNKDQIINNKFLHSLISGKISEKRNVRA